jgi:hypothetical protein
MREEQVIGTISACIAGDTRYTTVIWVKYLPKTGTVEVTREENGACSGMDGNGMSDPFHVLQRVSIARPDGKSIVKAVKMVMDSTIKTYGKPTKRFNWRNAGVGMSAALAQKALDWWTAD